MSENQVIDLVSSEQTNAANPAKVAAPVNNTMFNYFTKLPSKTSIVEEANPRKLAPVFNKQHVEEFQNRLEQFDAEISGNTETAPSTSYITNIRLGKLKPYKVVKKPRGPLRARLLQFHEDVRPPYFGTWQKKSQTITGRRPWALDTDVFDYDVDSEAEWDIGGPGESLKGDDSEDEEELDDYEIDMKTFVPHGYVSDDEVDVHSDNEEAPSADQSIEEVCDQQEDSNASVKIIGERNITAKSTVDQHRQSSANNQMQPPKQTPKIDIKPITIGLNYEDEDSTISESKIQFLQAFRGISCG